MPITPKKYMNDIKIVDNLKKKLDNNYDVFNDARTKRKKADKYTGVVGETTDESIFKTPHIKNKMILKGTKT